MPGNFAETDIAVDGLGFAHVAAAGSGAHNRGMWYLTNRDGTWTSQQVSTPPVEPGLEGMQYDGEPSIALDTDGSVWIAFTRWTCDECAPNPSVGIFMVNNAGGAWSEPAQLAGEQSHSPSLLGGGAMAYAEGMVPGRASYPVWMGYGADRQRVARNGSSPTLAANPHGGPNILFAASDIRLAYVLPGSIAIDRIPGSANGFAPVLFVQPEKDPLTGDVPIHVAWTVLSSDQQHFNVGYSALIGGDWLDPITAVTDGEATGIGAHNGVVHLAANDVGEAWGRLLYASNASGAFVASSLYASGGDRSALAVDLGGRPHVVFAVGEPTGQRGIWYALGPSV